MARELPRKLERELGRSVALHAMVRTHFKTLDAEILKAFKARGIEVVEYTVSPQVDGCMVWSVRARGRPLERTKGVM